MTQVRAKEATQEGQNVVAAMREIPWEPWAKATEVAWATLTPLSHRAAAMLVRTGETLMRLKQLPHLISLSQARA